MEPIPFVDAVHGAVGEALRSVTTYDRESYELLYVREDVETIYSTAEVDALLEALRLEGWGRERIEELFNAGQLECNLYGFEQAMVVHVVTGAFEGVVLTYDRGTDVDVEPVLDVCRTHLQGSFDS